MSSVPIICVQDVEKTSKLLQNLFNWKSNHGGPEFDDLADKKGRSVLWLHDFDSDHHPRFKGAGKKAMGIGVSIYVLVDDLVEDRRFELLTVDAKHSQVRFIGEATEQLQRLDLLYWWFSGTW
jgi:hypothetical protein